MFKTGQRVIINIPQNSPWKDVPATIVRKNGGDYWTFTPDRDVVGSVTWRAGLEVSIEACYIRPARSEPATPFERSLYAYIDKELDRI